MQIVSGVVKKLPLDLSVLICFASLSLRSDAAAEEVVILGLGVQGCPSLCFRFSSAVWEFEKLFLCFESYFLFLFEVFLLSEICVFNVL